MSVRVLLTIQTGIYDQLVTHPDAAWFATGEDGDLSLRTAADKLVAVYARGCWASATVSPEPEPVNAVTPLVNAAAEPDPRVSVATEAVLSETTEPYVCVSVTGPDPETVAETLARLA